MRDADEPIFLHSVANRRKELPESHSEAAFSTAGPCNTAADSDLTLITAAFSARETETPLLNSDFFILTSP